MVLALLHDLDSWMEVGFWVLGFGFLWFRVIGLYNYINPKNAVMFTGETKYKGLKLNVKLIDTISPGFYYYITTPR